MKNHCAEHTRSHEFVCFACNELMCSRCTINHNNDHPDHVQQYDHIDNIRHYLNNLNLSESDNSKNNNNSYNVNNKDNLHLKAIWETLKTSTSLYQSLSATEDEIKQHFEQLHQYLVIEEHKLRGPIINDNDTIINQIDSNINQLKYIVNIINLNNKLNNKLEYNSIDNNDDSQSITEDTTEQYSTTTIMKSIISSSSLETFISDNNQTLFNDDHDPFNIDELIKQYNNDSSSLLLDIIHKYNNQFNMTTEINDNNNNNNKTSSIQSLSYKLKIKQPDFNQLNSIINRSIKLNRVVESSLLTTNNDDNKSSYIFTTHRSRGATLINTSNNNSIEQLDLNYDFYNTYQSIVSIGEYIYVFGGSDNPKKWMKFSMKSKSIEHIGDFKGIKGDRYFPVCYDGQDHIYLVIDFPKVKIDRFNINTMTFERYYQLPDEYDDQISAMIFKGSLYSISYKENNILKLDLVNSTITNHQIDIAPFRSCHDNNGNFFIYDEVTKRLIKYNVESKQSSNLEPIPKENECLFLIYHQESPTSSFIYSFGGVRQGNFKYSVEDDDWKSFLEDDKFDREWCASTSIQY
ncbi:hypothetical protein PPL_08222 [Heterostelium album PN500]|uniref:B box-type domain-containing protein n=1 Tax=Heterostelium pallidum (strain ATCC 26659 / Pp 5 / PN500) TaxID=670386 RepID=D3BIY7_HETP5|nr:hypothetical protein PPL_08222 [Heterostelium album PN500]EFA78761.1 hypothetical protein PPL_08222 [Heterostelium album PN500]|eukprot:XP_020430885.1 hypothetical protein PPL_08222 [Heterostelium album PN500]